MAHVVVSGGKLATVGRKARPLPSRTRTETLSPRGVELPSQPALGDLRAHPRTQPWVFAAVQPAHVSTARIPYKLYDGRALRHAQPCARPRPRRPHQEAEPGHALEAPHARVGLGLLCARPRPAREVPAGSPAAMPTELWPVPWRYVAEIRDEAERILRLQGAARRSVDGRTPGGRSAHPLAGRDTSRRSRRSRARCSPRTRRLSPDRGTARRIAACRVHDHRQARQDRLRAPA